MASVFSCLVLVGLWSTQARSEIVNDPRYPVYYARNRAGFVMVYKAIVKPPPAQEYYVMTVQGCSGGRCVELKGIASQTDKPGGQIHARLPVDGCELHLEMIEYPPGYDSNQWRIDSLTAPGGRCTTIPAGILGAYTFRSTCFWSSGDETYESAADAAADCRKHRR